MLVSRHAILRTFFTEEVGERPLQVVSRDADSTFNYKDVSGDKGFSIEKYKDSDRKQGFELRRGSQMRLNVLGIGEKRYEFIWSHHHILMDGWCIGILTKDFFQIYNSLRHGQTVQLKKVYPYSNYIEWLSHIDQEASYLYWREYLSGYDTISSLPKSGVVDEVGYEGQEELISVGSSVSERIRLVCRELAITENTFIQTAWGILLCKYNNTNDVVFGSVVSGRPGEVEGIEEMIGLFINTVPVRIKSLEGIGVGELLKGVQKSFIEGTYHHYTQLAQIQTESKLGKNLFDHIVVFENYPVQEMVEEGIEGEGNKKEISVVSVDVFEQTNYDFSLTVIPGENICFKFMYNGKIYKGSLIKQIGDHLVRIMGQMVKEPDINIREIEYIGEEEKRRLLYEYNETAAEYPRDKTIVEMFEQQVERTPDAVAVVFEERSISYRELNERANQLGDYIRKRYKIKGDDLIGIKLERSEKMIVGILGILKSGGAYVPIDPGYPEERIRYMIEDSKCKVVIDEQELEVFTGSQEKYSKKNPKRLAGPENLAYVIYTSGSTGKPKGVMVEHRECR